MKDKNQNIEFLLKDNRLCKSLNLQAFFRTEKGRKMATHLGWFKETDGMRIIRFEGELWFVTLGWMASSGQENGFAGVRVKEAARRGAKATTGYPSWQKGGDYEDVTDWFWDRYKEQGIVSLPEIWNIAIPATKKHSELHTI